MSFDGWFGLDDQNSVTRDWDEGRRLRGWMAKTDAIDVIRASHGDIFGEKVPLSTAALLPVGRDGRPFWRHVGKGLMSLLELRLVDVTPCEALLQNLKS